MPSSEVKTNLCLASSTEDPELDRSAGALIGPAAWLGAAWPREGVPSCDLSSRPPVRLDARARCGWPRTRAPQCPPVNGPFVLLIDGLGYDSLEDSDHRPDSLQPARSNAGLENLQRDVQGSARAGHVRLVLRLTVYCLRSNGGGRVCHINLKKTVLPPDRAPCAPSDARSKSR